MMWISNVTIYQPVNKKLCITNAYLLLYMESKGDWFSWNPSCMQSFLNFRKAKTKKRLSLIAHYNSLVFEDPSFSYNNTTGAGDMGGGKLKKKTEWFSSLPDPGNLRVWTNLMFVVHLSVRSFARRRASKINERGGVGCEILQMKECVIHIGRSRGG